MKREFLQELKLEEETIAKIMAEHGKTVNSVKEKLQAKEEETKNLSEKLGIFEKQNKDTEKLLKDNADLKTQFESLQNTSKQQLEAKDKEINNIITKGLLKDELSGMGAVYPDLLIKNINLDELIIKDNKILNKETVLNPLKDTYKDLFKQQKIEGQNPTGGNNPPIPDTNNIKQLQDQYNEAVKNGNTAMVVKLKNDIFAAQQQKG